MNRKPVLGAGAIAALVMTSPALAQRIKSLHSIGDRAPDAAAQPLDFKVLDQVIKDVPRLDIVVRLPAGAAVPADLRAYVIQESPLGARLKIGTGAAAVEALRALPEFHAEFERPNSFLQPIIEVRPHNLDARRSHLVPEFEAEFPAIRGASVSVGIFDEGLVRTTHHEFLHQAASRIIVKTNRPLSRHSTHCAGTIGAKGVRAEAIGMAVQCRITSYDWNNDVVVLGNDGAAFQVSNHSYGPLSGWVPNYPMNAAWNWWGGADDREDARYGKYTDHCSALDEVLVKHEHLVTCFAAGNDRGMGPETQPQEHYVVASRLYSSRKRDLTGGDFGLDCISGGGLAKNAICVGAIHDVPATAGGNEIRITSFSGVGPADDGRVKPDVVANGYQLLSTSDANDSAYTPISGTSMATPTVSGIAACLWELFRATHNCHPTSAVIKASLIHTARDGGVPGPDPQYGWGSIDALEAGLLIGGKKGVLFADPEKHKVVEAGVPTEFKFNATGRPVRVTVVWIDPPAKANAGGIDDATPALMNDLDLRVTDPNGTVYLPYSLDLAQIWDTSSGAPKRARTDRANRVDNVEVVEAASVAGSWKVEVTGTKLVGAQAFVLAVSGLELQNP